jgi:mannose-6-phosphate isomerase-like protein (cupin superfamily)
MEPQTSTHTTFTKYKNIPAYITKDGSIIRELLHPDRSATRNQSLAEAIVEVGQTTALHYHKVTEEIYHITQGKGLMRLGEATFMVVVGDSIVIRPGTPHNITNTDSVQLKILCASAPAYSHDDTVLLD